MNNVDTVLIPFTIAPFPRPYGLEPATLGEHVDILEILCYNVVQERR